MHEVKWTGDKVRAFWDFSAPRLADLYFAKSVGRSVIRHVSKRIRIGTALDLGCGGGDLIGYLLAASYSACGSDQSPESVAIVNRRFADNPRFRGAFVGTDGLPPVDTVFMLEVVEHMDDKALTSALKDAKRLLKPGGHLVLTTPNDEDLEFSKRMCPDCGCVFHQMQHVRSWTAASLAEYVERKGFKTLASEATLFSAHKGVAAGADRLRFTLKGRKLPHLVYIGQP